MSSEAERVSPDLTPWDRDLAQRVQPVLSALFHDIMSPLTLMKNRLFLIRRHLQQIERDPAIDPAVRERLVAIENLLIGLEDATSRIHRGMTVPRDAVWDTLLEGTLFEPSVIIEQIGAAMKGDAAHDKEDDGPAAEVAAHDA